MSYRFLNKSNFLLKINNAGGVILSYIYRDEDTLLADGFKFCMLVADRRKHQGCVYHKIYQLYYIGADNCAAIYALLDTNLDKPIIALHEPVWYTKCDHSDIVILVVQDIQLIRYFRDMPHEAISYFNWCRTQHCYTICPHTEYLVCNTIKHPIRAEAGTVLVVKQVQDGEVTFIVKPNPVTSIQGIAL